LRAKVRLSKSGVLVPPEERGRLERSGGGGGQIASKDRTSGGWAGS